MTIEIKKRNDEAVIKITGVLDEITAKALEKTIDDSAKTTPKIILDLHGIENITSEGLLILLSTRKKIKKVGSLKLRGVCENVVRVIETNRVNA